MEISEVQKLKNDFILLREQLYNYSQPVQQVRSIVNEHYKKLTEYKEKWDKEIISHREAFKVLSSLEKRFKEIENFMHYLLNFFDPKPKIKNEINKLNKIIQQKDIEITKMRNVLKEALK